MGRFIISVFLLIFLFGCSHAQKHPVASKSKYVIAFYNVENLFDTVDDKHADDNEFLPSSPKKWNTKKYWAKINALAHVLSSIDSVDLPDLIGLAEVENREVLKDLVDADALKKGKYKIIHKHSSDPRGIDEALLYKPSAFSEILHRKIPVYAKETSSRSMREPLYVCGMLGDDTVHIIVNHWKSRAGKEEETESKRIAYAKTIRGLTDSILSARPSADIILMGDFNDTPSDISIKDYLKAGDPASAVAPKSLYDLMTAANARGEGSHFYNNWFLFDQIIVSSDLLSPKKKGLVSEKEAVIFKRNWMMYKTASGGWVPDKTYGPKDKYYGGPSDHLPVYVILKNK